MRFIIPVTYIHAMRQGTWRSTYLSDSYLPSPIYSADVDSATCWFHHSLRPASVNNARHLLRTTVGPINNQHWFSFSSPRLTFFQFSVLRLTFPIRIVLSVLDFVSPCFPVSLFSNTHRPFLTDTHTRVITKSPGVWSQRGGKRKRGVIWALFLWLISILQRHRHGS